MPSAIQKVSMGVSATPAATNQNCVSERLRIGMMSHADDALTKPVERNPVAPIFHTQRPGSVVFCVAVLHGSVVWRRGVDGRGGWAPPDPGQSPCHSKRTRIAVITSRSSGTE
jgi:hypothetical protein